MLSREEWLQPACKLDWEYSYVHEKEVFLQEISGRPWPLHAEWNAWDESSKNAYREDMGNPYEEDMAMYVVCDGEGASQ